MKYTEKPSAHIVTKQKPCAKGLWENPDILKAVLQTNPMKRIGDPDEIAGTAILLSSKAGNYINGQTIVIDGGTTAV